MKPRILDRKVRVTIDGRPQRLPLARAIAATAGDARARAALRAQLSVADRLRGFGEVPGRDTAEDADARDFFFDHFAEGRAFLGRLRAEGKRWAPRFADRLAAGELAADEKARWLVFVALVRARIPIRPAWDRLLPLGFGAWGALARECARAIPDARRAAAIAAALTPVDVEAGLALLAAFPSAEVARAVLALIPRTVIPKRVVVARVAAVAARRPAVAAALARWKRGQPEPIALVARAARRVRRPADLGAVARRQLAAAGRWYDGFTVAELFGADVTCVRIDDAAGAPAYDAWLFMGDAGVVCAAGQATIVAHVIQGALECDDAALRDGLEAALADHL